MSSRPGRRGVRVGTAARLTAALAFAAAGTACVATTDERSKVAEQREASGLRPDPVRMPIADVRAHFVGRTRVTSAGDRGVQVTYMDPDGTSHLWFPGNPVVLRGRWTIEQAGGYVAYAGRPVGHVDICFQYGPNTVNAWTGRRSDRNCILADMVVKRTLESAPGDVFGLASRDAVPFVLSNKPMTIGEIKSRIGSQ